jgi:hypothetical protein
LAVLEIGEPVSKMGDSMASTILGEIGAWSDEAENV